MSTLPDCPSGLLFSTHFELKEQQVIRERKSVDFVASTWWTKTTYLGRRLAVTVSPGESYNSSYATNSGERLRTGGVRQDAVELHVSVLALDGQGLTRNLCLSVAWLMTREQPEAVLVVHMPGGTGETARFHGGRSVVERTDHPTVPEQTRLRPAPTDPSQLALFAP